jgi:hypothetical protein
MFCLETWILSNTNWRVRPTASLMYPNTDRRRSVSAPDLTDSRCISRQCKDARGHQHNPSHTPPPTYALYTIAQLHQKGDMDDERSSLCYSSPPRPDRLWGPYNILAKGYKRLALSLGVKRPGREADHSPASSAKVENHSTIHLHGVMVSYEQTHLHGVLLVTWGVFLQKSHRNKECIYICGTDQVFESIRHLYSYVKRWR